MITPDTITRKQARKLLEMLKRWTCAEIVARHAPLPWPDWGDYYFQAMKIEDEIRTFLYDEKDLHQLGCRWGMIAERRRFRGLRKKKKVKRKRANPK